MTKTQPQNQNKAHVKKSSRNFLKPQFIQEWAGIWKEHGFQEFIRRKGWKVVTAVVLFYLIRDSILYLILPYLAARGILGC